MTSKEEELDGVPTGGKILFRDVDAWKRFSQ